MGISGFIKRRWAAHNARLLSGELTLSKAAHDPGSVVGGSKPGGPSAMLDLATGAPFSHASTSATVVSEIGATAGGGACEIGGGRE